MKLVLTKHERNASVHLPLKMDQYVGFISHMTSLSNLKLYYVVVNPLEKASKPDIYVHIIV